MVWLSLSQGNHSPKTHNKNSWENRIRNSVFSIPLHCFESSVCHHMLSMSLGLLLSKPSRDLTYWVCQNMQWQSGTLRRASIMRMESQFFCTVISVYEISWACRGSVTDFQDNRLQQRLWWWCVQLYSYIWAFSFLCTYKTNI